MRHIISKPYLIGTGAGEHKAGTNLVDSFIGLIPENVASISINDQNYNVGLVTGGDNLDFSGVGTQTSNGDVLTVNFKESIQIGNCCSN